MQSSTKKYLRRMILEEIDALPHAYIEESDKGLFLRMAVLREFIDARSIMMYYSVKREPDTLCIAEAALAMGKTVSFPQCCKDGIMHARAVRALSELQTAVLGIPAPPESAPLVEPGTLDLIIVPAITYDKHGYRLGYGGGYYDRYLSRTSAFTLGLARERLVKDELPREPHDIAVRCLMTESRGDLFA